MKLEYNIFKYRFIKRHLQIKKGASGISFPILVPCIDCVPHFCSVSSFAGLLLHLLIIQDLQSLIPSPGAMGSHVPCSFLDPISGVRVAPPASGEDESQTAVLYSCTPGVIPWGMGISEPWPCPVRNRYNKFKRSYIRACFRSLTVGIATYKSQPLYPRQIPFRLR